MTIINTILGIPLGYVMYLCFQIARNYGLAILVFTLVTKILMLPLSFMSQKNAIVMARIQPALEDIKKRNFGNSGLIVEEQKALYKAEGYSSLKGLLPLLIQIPLVLGLINVIYNPLQHLLHLDQATIQGLLQRTADLVNQPLDSLGTSGQLKVLEWVQARPEFFAGMEGIEAILAMDTRFLGINLTHIPQLGSLTLLYPLLSGLSALALAAYQNKYYVLQQGQSPFRKGAMTLFLVAFSFFFAYILPCGVGLYWVAGNLVSIGVLALSNKLYDPSPYMDAMKGQGKPRRSREERGKIRQEKRAMRQVQKADRKRFAAWPDKALVFYSEAGGFYKYYFGFIDHILAHSDLVIHYVTSDFHDPILQNDNPRIQSYYIGPLALIQFMMRMDADMVVMTTPDLETYHIKRSLVRKDIEYVYIDHGMASFHLMYRKGALDHFDTIFCYGPSNIAEVRETEKRYGLAPKRLVKTGFPLLDSMLEKVKALDQVPNDPPVILVAPSWQKDNILELCLHETLDPLLAAGYRVTVRPHPEFVKRFPAKIQAIQDHYGDQPSDRLEIQTDFSDNETVYRADLVITDWSSIAQEFSYASKKPSLFINTPMKILNPEYDQIPIVPLDISLRDQIGVSIDPGDLDQLADQVARLLADKDSYREQISLLVNQNIFDVGDGARAGGQYIIHSLEAARQREGQPVAEEAPPDDRALFQDLQEVLAQRPTNDPALEALLDSPLDKLDPAIKSHRHYLLWLTRTLKEGGSEDPEKDR